MICLATPRLLLRTWRSEDCGALDALFVGSVPSFGILSLRHLGGISEAGAALERFAQAWSLDGHGLFAVEALEGDALLGLAGVQPGDASRSALELAWQIANGSDTPGITGEVAAIEAVAAVIDWAFGLFDVEVIEATIGIDDDADARVATAAGMTSSAVMINSLTNEKTHRFAITRAAWSSGEP